MNVKFVGTISLTDILSITPNTRFLRDLLSMDIVDAAKKEVGVGETSLDEVLLQVGG